MEADSTSKSIVSHVGLACHVPLALCLCVHYWFGSGVKTGHEEGHAPSSFVCSRVRLVFRRRAFCLT